MYINLYDTYSFTDLIGYMYINMIIKYTLISASILTPYIKLPITGININNIIIILIWGRILILS